MSSQHDAPEAGHEKVSPRRRRLVKGAAAAVPAILTLRAGAQEMLASQGLVTKSDTTNAVQTDASDPLDGELEYLCLGGRAAPGYDGHYDADPGSSCFAEDEASCIEHQQNQSYETGILVSGQSVKSIGLTVAEVQASELCN